MNLSIRITTAGLLAAAAQFAAKRDVRYYLCGVLLEVRENKMSAVATDGHKMIRVDLGSADIPTPDFKGILPSPELLIKHCAGRNACHSADLHFVDGLAKLTVGGTSITLGKLVDGTFPDYRRVMVSGDVETSASAFNPALLAAVCKSAEFIGAARRCKIQPLAIETCHQSSKRITIGEGPAATVVLMPLRMSAEPKVFIRDAFEPMPAAA